MDFLQWVVPLDKGLGPKGLLTRPTEHLRSHASLLVHSLSSDFFSFYVQPPFLFPFLNL